MASSSTSPTQALCLLLVVIFVAVGATSAAAVNDSSNARNKIQLALPGSCLMAASTLCANADTNTMRCLRKLAIKGDARVPTACSEALMATMNPRRNQATRVAQLARLLTEGNCNNPGGNTCAAPATHAGQFHAQCNDVLAGCGGCASGTATIPASAATINVGGGTVTANGVACSDVCCKDAAGGPACCYSQGSVNNRNVFCVDVAFATFCNPQ